MKLEVKDIRKTFGDKEVLHGINFAVESGRALGLLGRNGAGKTTTIRILMDVYSQSIRSVTCRRSGGCTPKGRCWTR